MSTALPGSFKTESLLAHLRLPAPRAQARRANLCPCPIFSTERSTYRFFARLSAVVDNYVQKSRVEQRVLAQLRRFVDLEAVVADDDDEDEEGYSDLGDFIDDGEPSHEPLPELRERAELLAVQTPAEQAQELEAIAQRFVERCRRESAQRVRSPHLSAGSKHDLPSVPPSTAELLEAPLYTCKVRPSTEMRLIKFLMAYEGVHSVFTRALGSGAVYVECSDGQNLDAAMRDYEKLYHSRRTPPTRIDSLEALPTILLSPPLESLYGKWKRLSKPCGTLIALDLVLVVDAYILLGLPRIPYGKSKTVPTALTNTAPAPQELFSPQKFREWFPSKQLERRNTIYSWSDFVWNAAGLEMLSWSDDRDIFSRKPAIPTEAEREMFCRAQHPDLDLPYSGRTCALQEGDRVVVVPERVGGINERTLESCSGFIQAIVERSSPAHPDKVVRYAAVNLQSEHVPELALDALAKNLRGDNTSIFPLRRLRLHILAPPRTISLGDRVIIVGGTEARGMSGRVRDISAEGIVTMNILDLDVALDVEMRFIQHDFRIGDVLEVIRGPHSGAVGFVLEVNPGGSIELFLVCQLFFLKSSWVFAAPKHIARRL